MFQLPTSIWLTFLTLWVAMVPSFFRSDFGPHETALVEGTIVYDYYMANADLDRSKMSAQHLQYADEIERQLKIQDDIKLVLHFTERRSLCKLQDRLVPPEDEYDYLQATVMPTDSKKNFYHDRAARLKTMGAKLEGALVNIIVPYKTYDWRITGQEKCVGDRTLLEAVTTRTITAPDGQEEQYPVRAWYDPTLPYPYGPCGYDGLPGVILELRLGEKEAFGYTAEEITLERDPAKPRPIKKPRAAADIDQGEFYRRLFDIRAKRGY